MAPLGHFSHPSANYSTLILFQLDTWLWQPLGQLGQAINSLLGAGCKMYLLKAPPVSCARDWTDTDLAEEEEEEGREREK